jgi:diketogulonate reductase-like aldo/keto reductase
MTSTGAGMARLGQGTWQMEEDDRPSCIAALRRGLDLGLTHIDTAELYGRGEVETLVGEAIAGRRDEVHLVSKVLPQNASYDGTVAACERSLRRLGTDRLDGYLLHWPGRHPLAETLRAFEDLQRAGKLRAYGVSNFDERGLAEAVGLAGEGKLSQNQVLYHLGERAIEHAVLPFCEAHGIALVGYSPFGSGDFPEGSDVLAAVAAAHGATPRQVALAFLTRRPSLFAIPKAARPAHVKENAGAVGLSLSAQELSRIDAAFPRGPRRPGIPTL